jgi:hypothetical protein
MFMDSSGSGLGQVVSFCGCGVAGRMPVVYLAQNRDRWWAFVNMVMNFWVS